MQEELNEALAHLRAINAVLVSLTGAQPAPAAPSPTVLRSDFDAKLADLDRAKRLLTSIYAMSPPAVRVVIERNTGAWFALGVNRDESAAPAAQPAGSAMTAEQIEALAHREAWRYVHGSSNPKNCANSLYTFNRATLLEFARALVAKETPHAR